MSWTTCARAVESEKAQAEYEEAILANPEEYPTLYRELVAKKEYEGRR